MDLRGSDSKTVFQASVLNIPFSSSIPPVDSEFTMRVRAISNAQLQNGTSGEACPFNCFDHGVCKVTMGPPPAQLSLTCVCDAGWAGLLCDGQMLPMAIDTTVTGSLDPGMWRYFRLDFSQDHNSARDGLVIQLAVRCYRRYRNNLIHVTKKHRNCEETC